MTSADLIAALLAACPTIAPAWQEHLDAWGVEEDRGDYLDVLVISGHVADSFEQGEMGEFPAVFAVLERCVIEGNAEAQNLAVIGLIEDIQSVASFMPFGPEVFLEWLGPASRVAWDELWARWDYVLESQDANRAERIPDKNPEKPCE